MKNSFSKLLGSVLLVSGTAIGAGMLALPVATGLSGFIPASLLFLGYWVYMTFTAFLLLEVNLWMDGPCNLITMARSTLGKAGEWISWILFLFLLYTLTTAYLAGSTPILQQFALQLTGKPLPDWGGLLIMLGVFGLFVYQGAKSVEYINRFLMFGLFASFLVVMVMVIPHIHAPLLMHTEWSSLWIGVSIVSTSFGFHIVIPTLVEHLNHEAKEIRWVIFIGSLIPLLVYLLWECVVLGIVPGVKLSEGYHQGLDGATILGQYLSKEEFALPARLFSFFAIITSFLGVTLSLRDFLADGFGIRKSGSGRLFLYILTFAPPLLIVLNDPRAFIDALEYAGAFGVVTLLGLMPVLMTWWGRYKQHRYSPFPTPGGKAALIAALTLSVAIIILEICNKTGLISE